VVSFWRQSLEAKAVGLKGQSTLAGAQHDEPPSSFDGGSCVAPVAVVKLQFLTFYYTRMIGFGERGEGGSGKLATFWMVSRGFWVAIFG